MRLYRYGLRLLQSSAVMLVAYLFVCLMTASLRQSPLSLALPSLGEPDSNSTFELLLFSVPGQLLLLLLCAAQRGRRWLISAFVLAAGLTALLQCLLFAEAFGSTWSTAEILGLWAFNLPALLLALIPGLALFCAVEQISPVRRSHSRV